MAESLVPERVASSRSLLSGIRVVDADTHVSEWYDLWTSRAPPALRHRVPQLRHGVDGVDWVIDGGISLGANCAASAIRKDGVKARGWEFMAWQNADVHPGSYDLRARLDYMAKEGISAQIAYPNVLGFGGQAAMMVDAELRLLSTRIYNDAMAELQADSGNRIYPMALLPWWDPLLAAEEAARCNDMGLRGININPDPHNHGLPPLGDGCWDPLWKTCCERAMPVNFHIGASDESMTWLGLGQWPNADRDRQLAYGSLMLFVNNLRVMANILLDGFLLRFPELKMVSVESGAGWVPFLLEALEYQSREAGIARPLSVMELFRRHIHVCTWFEREHLVETVRAVGVENVMFETDFPHPTCLYPDPLDYMREPLAAMDFEARGKVFGGNAERIYNLDLAG